MEPLKLPTNSGRQAAHNVTVIVSWNRTDYKKARNEDKIIIFPAEANLESHRILFLLIEVVPGSPRQDVIQTLKSAEVTKWLEICDNALLKIEENSPRRMFRDLARAMEVTISEIIGESSIDPNLSLSIMNLAKSLTESYVMLSTETTIEILSKYNTDTVKLITYVDHDSKLVFIVLNMIAKRYSVYTNTNWDYLFKLEDMLVTWPNFMIPWNHQDSKVEMLPGGKKNCNETNDYDATYESNILS